MLCNNKKSFNTLGLTFALWAMFSIYFFMWDNAAAAAATAQEQPVPFGPGAGVTPDECPNFWLPEPSPELDQILAAQVSISEKVFTAGREDFRYCVEGGWKLDSDFYEMKVTDFDIPPITGTTIGGEPLTAYLFMVLESPDLSSFDFTEEELQWIEDHDYAIYIVGGVVETDLGFAGFYALAQQMDWEGERLNFLLPFQETDVFDYIYTLYMNPENIGGKLASCIQNALEDHVVCTDTAKDDLDTCLDSAIWDGLIAGGGGFLGCLIPGLKGGGLIIIKPLLFYCSLAAIILGVIGFAKEWNDCVNQFDSAIDACNRILAHEIDQCIREFGGTPVP